MYRLEVKLKQHTPLIHFQWQQEGATLRASEVKPLLDKYIFLKLGDGDYIKGSTEAKSRCWQIEEHDALDYQLKIVANDLDPCIHLEVYPKFNSRKQKDFYYTKINHESEDDFPFLMSNMGGKENKEELLNLRMYDTITLKFNVSSQSLCEEIKLHIESFFALTNFGQRSSKGFGSFTVIQIDEDKKTTDLKGILPAGTPFMKFSVVNAERNSLNKQVLLFKTLDFYWRCLKSGINYTKRQKEGEGVKIAYSERYIKAYLWHYLEARNLTWEKRWIKNQFQLETSLPVRHYSDNSNKAIFARGFLGCPAVYEYRVPQGIYYNTKRGIKEEIKSYVVEVEHSEQEDGKKVARIPSPIYFKPVFDKEEVRVFVLVDQQLVKKISEIENPIFLFKCDTSDRAGTHELRLDISQIDFLGLIRGFHNYLWKDSEARKSIFHAVKMKEEEMKYAMIPRGYNWMNILGQCEIEGKRKENLVKFFQTV